MTRVTIFGGPRIWREGVDVTPPGALPRRVLAALALAAPADIATQTLIEAAWGPEPPPTAASALRTQVARLRRSMGGGICVQSGAYRLDPSVPVDLVRYRELTEPRTLRPLEPAERLGLLDEALRLWSGDPFGSMSTEPWFAEEARTLEARHLDVEDDWIEAVVEHDPPPFSALWRLARAQPLREVRWSTLIRTLHRRGRTVEAVAAYDEARRTIADEVGLAPGAAVTDAYDEIFATTQSRVPAAPLQEPGGPMVGRHAELAAAERLMAVRGSQLTIVGIGGIGKTRLALELVSRARRRGLSTVVLRVPPRDLRVRFCRELVAPFGATPPSEVSAADLLIDRLASVDLVVLDGAETCAHEVEDLVARVRERRPRLRMVVTSRRSLGTASEEVINLGPLPMPAPGGDWSGTAVELLARRRGLGDVVDPDVARELAADAATTGGIPLVIGLVGRSGPAPEGAAEGSHLVAQAARELRSDLESPSELLADALALLPGGVTTAQAASLLGCAEREADRRLRYLVWLGLCWRRPGAMGVVHEMADPLKEAIALDASARRTPIRQAFVDHVLAVGVQIRPDLLEPVRVERLTALDASIPNLCSVLDEQDDRFLDLAVQVADHLGSRGFSAQAESWLQHRFADPDPEIAATAALTAARMARLGGAVVPFVDHVVSAAETLRQTDPAAAVMASLYGALARSYQARFEESRSLVAIGRSLLEPGRWPAPMLDVAEGWVRVLEGDLVDGVKEVADAATRLDPIDRFGSGLAHFTAAACAVASPEVALPHLDAAYEAANESGDRLIIACCMSLEPDLRPNVGSPRDAHRRAASAFDAAGLPERATIARLNAARVAIRAGRSSEAIEDLLATIGPLTRAGSSSVASSLAGLALAVHPRSVVLAQRLADLAVTPLTDGHGYVAPGQSLAEARRWLSEVGLEARPGDGPDPDALDQVLAEVVHLG